MASQIRESSMRDSLVRGSALPRIRLHDLRHTYVTLALQADIHPKVVSERFGHATVSIRLTPIAMRSRHFRKMPPSVSRSSCLGLDSPNVIRM
jgi:integrase